MAGDVWYTECELFEWNMTTTNNMVLDSGGADEVTVYSVSVDEQYTKKLIVLTPANSTSNFPNGPRTTILIDLQRIERRFVVIGEIDEGDRTKFRNIINKGSSTNAGQKYTILVAWDDNAAGNELRCNIERATMKKDAKREDDHRQVSFTLIVGTNR